MKAVEKESLWHHTVFSSLLALLLIGIILIRRDTPTLFFVVIVGMYIIGNTYIHYRRKDFKSETVYEYVLVAAAVLIVLWSSL
ncbi:MAG: hypothetical protein JWP13_105 [Candidatus Saccharibacteria bacterium]|nr:hypothetical protein [Candidatus Saccharibacteria bacterium]